MTSLTWSLNILLHVYSTALQPHQLLAASQILQTSSYLSAFALAIVPLPRKLLPQIASCLFLFTLQLYPHTYSQHIHMSSSSCSILITLVTFKNVYGLLYSPRDPTEDHKKVPKD